MRFFARGYYRLALLRLAVSAALFAAGAAGAAAEPAFGGRPLLLPVDKAPLLFAAGKNGRVFAAEIARTDEEKQRGLMYRRAFPKNRAMLFVFGGAPRAQAMWMENTPLPLDIIFADKSGKIIRIYENAKPFSRNLISSLSPAAYAVELNAGQAKGLRAGQFIRHPVICGKCT